MTLDFDRELLGGRSAAEFLRAAIRFLEYRYPVPAGVRGLALGRHPHFAESQARDILERCAKAAGEDYDSYRAELWRDCGRVGSLAIQAERKRADLIAGRITEKTYRAWMVANWPEALDTGIVERLRARRVAARRRRLAPALGVAGD